MMAVGERRRRRGSVWVVGGERVAGASAGRSTPRGLRTHLAREEQRMAAIARRALHFVGQGGA